MNIARMNAALTATANGFSSTFAQAGQSAKGFLGTVASVASGVAAYDIGKSVAQSAYNNTVGLVKSQLEAIDSTAKLSDTLGISTRALSQLQYAASYSGTSTEDLAAGLTKLTKNLGDSSEEGGAAGKALASIGLNAKTLANEAPETAIGQIADALNNVPNAAQRAAAGQAIFGKGFSTLAPLLREGSAGLAEFAAEADKIGYSFDRVDAAKVEAANDAIQKVSNVITAIGTQLAIDLAPYISAAADQLSAMAMSGGNMGEIVLRAVEGVATGITYAAGVLDVLDAGWLVVKGTVLGVVSGILYGLDGLGSAIAAVANLLPGVSVSFEGVGVVAKSFAEDAGKAFSDAGDKIASVANGDRQAAVSAFFDGVKSQAQSSAEAVAKGTESLHGMAQAAGDEAAKIEEKIAALKQQVAEFGQTDAQKLATSLTAQGATQDQVKDAVGAQNQLDALKEQQKAHEDAQKAAENYYNSTRTDAEKYAEEIKRINDLQSQGLLDSDTAGRAKAAAQESLDKSQGDGSDKSKETDGPKLLQAGSAEAESFVANIQRRDGAGGDDTKTLVKQGDQSNKYLAQIAKNGTTNGGTTESVVVSI